ncbi:MAG TPA: AMP-binding protein [Bryobacterales bacterium]|nr:AMP-binding protein [Bryobacterales bacterium]
MNLNDLFDLTLKGCAKQSALEFQGSSFTFQDLDVRSNQWANQLRENGFERGDRLAVYLPNCVELLDAFLACAKSGIIFTPINVLYRGREIEHIVGDAKPRALLTNRDLSANAPGGSNVWCVEDLNSQVGQRPAGFSAEGVEGDSLAALVYTSGTTGRSKGAALTHNNFAANATALNTCWRMSASDRMLLALPLFHVHGLGNGLHTWLSSGYQVRLLERFRKETILDEFLDFKPTVFFGVPTMYERLLAAPPEVAREIGLRMRLFVSGSAPLPAATLERFRELFGHTILERYGMSETMMNLSNPYAGERRPGSVGKPLPGVSIRLADPASDDGRVEVADGETGEVLIKGPNVFSGYWRQPEATTQAFTADGYFRSGDLAARSSDGYYTLQGRRTELILCGGFNVYPREIEEFLCEQAGVAEAAVVGVPDQVKGQAPVAYVVPAAGFDAEALLVRCREELASFKTPRKIVVIDELPRNALGKVQRHLLAAKGMAK